MRTFTSQRIRLLGLLFLALVGFRFNVSAQSPVLTSQPVSQNVLLGGNAALSVQVSGTGPFAYQWRLNGTNLPNIISTVAGNGAASFSGDNGPATNASFNQPVCAAVDGTGNVYISDYANNRVRKVGTTGIVTTFAGNGGSSYSGDGGQATNAQVAAPFGVAVDGSGNVFVATYVVGGYIRKIATNGIITTVAGNGTTTYPGDGGAATNAGFGSPIGVAVDNSGNLFIADNGNSRVFKVASNGIISTVAGNGGGGDGGPAVNASIYNPYAVGLDAKGNLFITERNGTPVRKVDTNGIITTVAGGGVGGDGGSATNASLPDPAGVVADAVGDLFIASISTSRIRKVSPDGIITTFAGSGTAGYSGDGGAATSANLTGPFGLAMDANGDLFIGEQGGTHVREVLAFGPALQLNGITSSNLGNYDVVVTSQFGSVTSAVASVSVSPDSKVLMKAEYFWDSDPGNGNGTAVDVPGGESFTFGAPGGNLLNIDTTSLAAGLHKLGFRMRDAAGNWSDINWLPVQVQNAATLAASVNTSAINDFSKLLATGEYFWDADPGFGNGTSVSVPAGESFTAGAPGSSVLNINTASLAVGLHKLGFRVRDAAANWSDINWLPVQVQNAATLAASVATASIDDASKKLVAAEYFWDNDPGNGNGTAVSVPAGESFTFGDPGTNLFTPDVSSLAAGVHQLGFRTEDAATNWSDINWLPVEVPGTPLILLNGQYYSNNVVMTTNGASYQVTLTSKYPNATIFYTTDGSDPNGGDYYSGPFNVTAPFSIGAVAYSEDFSLSAQAGTVNSFSLSTPGGGSITNVFSTDSTSGVVSVNLTAMPLAGWTLINWSGDASGTNTNVSVVVDGPKSVQATFGTSLTTSGAGQVLRQPDLTLYPYGSTVQLTAVPTNNTTFFRQWGGSANGQFVDPLNFVFTNANPTISAVFFTLPANTHSLTVLIGGNGAGYVAKTPQQSNYVHNASVTLTAAPASGSVFVNWTGDTNSTLDPLGVLMDTNKIITANFSTNNVAANQPPTVAITNPVSGAGFTAPVNVTLNATASDSDGTVVQVVFMNGAGVLGTVTSAPYNFVWTNAPVGTNTLTAVATDNGGLSTTSAPVKVIVQTALPQVALISPTNNASYQTNASILISAIASDADNSIARVELYSQAATNNSQPGLLAEITNAPFNFTWSGMSTGTYTLTAWAIDSYGPIVTSAPVVITVTLPPSTNPPVFLFSAANYFVNESNGAVVVTVLNNGDLGGLVSYTTVDGTAHGGSGFSGSYTIAQGSFSFANGQTSTNLTIGIRDNYITGADIQFTVQLFNPSAGILGTPSTATVTIHQNDIGGATNSLLTTASPSAQPATAGALEMVLTPSAAGGQWRFPWEQGWHLSGDTATTLEAGNYPIQFRDVPNYLAVPASVSIAVTNGGTTIVTNQLSPTYTSFDTNNTGTLTVNIGPNTPSGLGWRFIGESSWRANNAVVSSLLPDTYFIEYEPVSGWAKPSSQAVQVFGGQATIVSANYQLASLLPGGVTTTPSQITSSAITDIANHPYGFNGQLYTDVGYGSGVAVRESVVLTAAHMVFNDATLSYVNQAYWSFQKEVGTFSPEPIPARGWYVLSGYAAQRTNDLQVGGYGIDQSSPQSRDLDVAALYFLTPAARGGYGGYLASDAVPNPYLTGSNLKTLVGYPVDGSYYGQTIVPGTMYATAELSTALTRASNNVYSASWFLSYPGNSGGPLYVRFNNYYYPAAVYLGSLGTGNNAVSVVRAINSDVVNLISLASSQGDSGTNYTGGGVITIIPNQAITVNNPGYVQMQLVPPAAVQAGAAWKLSSDPDSAYSTATNYIRAVTTTNAIGVQFKPVAGWNLPTNQLVSVSPGQIASATAYYTVTNPVVMAGKGTGLGISGTIGTVYRLEHRTSLTSGTWLPVSTNTILTNGFNLLLPNPSTNGSVNFYRAVWLGQ